MISRTQTTRRGFMCKIDFELEIEGECDPASFTAIYATEDQCRELRGCTDGCGMVEVEVSLIRDGDRAIKGVVAIGATRDEAILAVMEKSLAKNRAQTDDGCCGGGIGPVPYPNCHDCPQKRQRQTKDPS